MRCLVEIRFKVKGDVYKTKSSGMVVFLKEGVTTAEAHDLVSKIMPKAIELCGAENEGEIMQMLRIELGKIGDVYGLAAIVINPDDGRVW